jgi:hypothetical protein
MSSRLFVAVALLGGTLLAQTSITVSQLVDVVRSSRAMKYDDAKIAKYLKTVKLSEKLDDKTVQKMKMQGAGQKTVKALQDLQADSANLKMPAPSKADGGAHKK